MYVAVKGGEAAISNAPRVDFGTSPAPAASQ